MVMACPDGTLPTEDDLLVSVENPLEENPCSFINNPLEGESPCSFPENPLEGENPCSFIKNPVAGGNPGSFLLNPVEDSLSCAPLHFLLHRLGENLCSFLDLDPVADFLSSAPLQHRLLHGPGESAFTANPWCYSVRSFLMFFPWKFLQSMNQPANEIIWKSSDLIQTWWPSFTLCMGTAVSSPQRLQSSAEMRLQKTQERMKMLKRMRVASM